MSSKVRNPPILSAMFLVALGLILALGLAACGSGGGSSSSSGSATTTEPAGETEGDAKDVAAAEEEEAGGEESFGGAKPLAELYKGDQEPPPTSGPPAQKDKFVVWVSCGQISPGCAGPAEAFQEAGTKLGWKTQIIDGKLNENNGLTVGIRDAIALHPDAIGMVGVDCSLVKAALQEAQAANIPVLGLESFDCNEEEGGEGEPSLFTIPSAYSKTIKTAGDWFETWGSTLTEYVINKTEGKATTLNMDLTEDPVVNYMIKGNEAAAAKCDECETVDLPVAISELSSAGLIGRKVETALLKNPDVNSVTFNISVTALSGGGAKAIVNSGRQDELVVAGGESSVEANELVRSGQGLNALISLPLNWLGWAAADLINRNLAGEPAAPQGIGFQVIDKENNLPPEGKEYEPEIDYKAAYEKVWGG